MKTKQRKYDSLYKQTRTWKLKKKWKYLGNAANNQEHKMDTDRLHHSNRRMYSVQSQSRGHGALQQPRDCTQNCLLWDPQSSTAVHPAVFQTPHGLVSFHDYFDRTTCQSVDSLTNKTSKAQLSLQRLATVVFVPLIHPKVTYMTLAFMFFSPFWSTISYYCDISLTLLWQWWDSLVVTSGA